MIRKMDITDTDRVAEIWLATNIKAHSFIPGQYWADNFASVKEMLKEAEVYVYVDGDRGEIQGFIGIDGQYIEGVFVRSAAQSNGIGRRLLDFVKTLEKRLTLHVYRKNERAVRFYQREHFKIRRKETDVNTGEEEYVMVWDGNTGSPA